eukprot:gene16278-22459_t
MSMRMVLALSSPLLKVVCYIILAQMGANFLRAVVDPDLSKTATYADSAYTTWAIKQDTSCIRAMASIHDHHLMSQQPIKTLQIITGLWLVSIVAQYINFFSLLSVVYTLAFILPKVYDLNRAKIDPVVDDLYTKGMKQFNQTDLRLKAALIIVPVLLLGYFSSKADMKQFNQTDLRLKAALIIVPVLLLGYFSSKADMVIAGFVVMAYARTQFRDVDVQKGVKIVADKTATTQFGKSVGSFCEKHELTPTKKKVL